MHKDKILFFNIGNRDIKLDGKELNKNEIRSKGKEIFNNFDQYKSKINIELIEPFLNQFKDDIKKIYLFATNQEDSEYNLQDTLYFGRIIQKILEEDYKTECEVKEYIHNPTDYELVFDFFINFFKNFDDSTLKIISNSGGIPAMKFSILLVATSLFNNLEVYSVDEKTNQLKEVQYKNTIKKEFIKKSALEFLDKFNYTSIISLIERNRIENQKLMFILEYCKHRLNFDFETANNKLNGFLSYLTSNQRDDFNEYLVELKNDQKKLISELWLNMYIKWDNKEYIDFIGRLFRFSEVIPQYLISLHANIKIEWSNEEEAFDKLNLFISNYEGMSNFLSNVRKLEKTERGYKPNRHVLTMCLRYLIIKNILVEEDLMSKVGKINELIDKLRHKSVVAHGFESVTKERIIKEYGESDLVKDINYICGGCEINTEEILNSLLKLNQYIKSLILEL